MTKAVGYCRVSSQEQINGTSLTEQQKQIEAYATLNGLELVNIYVDAGVSGGKALADRPNGSKLIAALETGEAQAVILAKLDRGFRRASDCLATVETWEKHGISLHILNMGGQTINTGSAMGKLFLSMAAAFAECEKNLINERCNSGRAARKAEGRRVGEVPFGWTLGTDGKTLVENADEQEALRLIQDLRGKGNSLRAIAHELNARGVVAKKGGAWGASQVDSILKRIAA
jgi:site-specific DNA recombinase